MPWRSAAAQESSTSSAADLGEQLPRVPPTEPAGALATFRVQGGFRLDLLAAEPLVTDPVAMEYDENGLAYVVEMSDYPYTDKSTDKPNTERTTDLPLGKVRILEDTDGDGRFDRSDTFARDLSWPTGLAFWKQGVFVAATPDIWYLKDTDGDRRADVREKVYTGFRKYNVQAVMNNLKWGLDHRIYGAGSSNGGSIKNLATPEAPPVTLSRNDFRFDPTSRRFEVISGGARFGNSFDDWGNRFICNIRNPAQHVVLPNHYLARNPHLPVPSALHDAAEAGDTLPVYRISPPEPWRAVRAERWAAESGQRYPKSELVADGYFTSSSGITVYRGAAYPREYHGNLFVAEVSGNLIHRQTLEPAGATFTARRADVKKEFVASTDNWFRPVNFVNAPDGTLHVCDMYRETIEHPWSIPDDIKAHLDLESGRDRGRIYRLSPPGFQVPTRPKLGSAATAELVACLENPNSWWRETAQRLLYERQDKAAIEPLRELLQSSKVPLARLHALWCLAGLEALSEADLLLAIQDASAGVREHAVLLAEQPMQRSPALLEAVLAAANDDAARVRFQSAFSLGESDDPRVAGALTAIARRDAADPWIRAAVLSSSSGRRAAEIACQLLADASFCGRPEAAAWFKSLATVSAASGDLDGAQKPLKLAAGLPGESAADRGVEISIVAGLGEGCKARRTTLLAALPATSPGHEFVRSLIQDMARLAGDGAAPLAEREQAIQLLAYGDFSTAQPALTSLLDPRQPAPLQMAAVRCLSSFAHPQVAGLLLSQWNTYTPPIRVEVVEALAGRTDRLGPLLDAVESRMVNTAAISPTRKNLLLRHANEAIRNRAARLFAHDAPGPRHEVLAQYQKSLTLAADKVRGENVFKRECQACHKLRDKGHDVGPNLATVLHRTPQELLAHVLDPNREVAPNFLEYVIALDDGRVITGLIATETATSLVLRRAENQQETVLRQNIDEMASTGKSLMPEGFEKKIPTQEMADLLAYLLAK